MSAEELRGLFDELCAGFVRAVRYETDCTSLTAASHLDGETVVLINGH